MTLDAVQHVSVRAVAIVMMAIGSILAAIRGKVMSIGSAPEFRDEHRRQILETVFAFRAREVIAVPALAKLIGDLVNDECRVRLGCEHLKRISQEVALFGGVQD